jgi:PAS domain S-box-containing protein
MTEKTNREIRELKQAESELTNSKQMLELVMNTIPQFIFWKDRNSVYLGCNQNGARVAGLSHPSDIVGKTDYDLAWRKEEADFFRECDERVMSTGKAEYHIIEQQRQADGKNAWLDTNKVPLFDEKGNVTGI